VTAPLFLAPHAALVGDELTLDGLEGRHAATVRRVRAGERVDLTDGSGLRVECLVREVDGRDVVHLAVIERIEESAPQPRFVVVQAIPKGDRGELAVETMTEAGVDVVVPWAAARCVARWKGERGAKSAQRWRSSAREAAKQAHRSWLPEVRDQASTAEVAELVRAAAVALVLHEEADRPVGSVEVPADGDVLLVVGPEGGVAPDELAEFERAGASAVRLGPTVLRTSTAGVVALGVLMSRTARWA
jgi:16S rRNA (uracil1498-N3)-methyltransferase